MLSIRHIGLDLHFGVVPGHTVILGIGRTAEAVQNHVCNCLTVNGVGNGLADLDVAGHIVANGSATFSDLALVRQDRKSETAVIRRSNGFHMVAGYFRGAQSCGGVSNVHLTCLHGSQSGILGHEHHGHILDSRFSAVVVFVGSE